MVKAKEVMNTCVITIGADEDIYEAVRLMAQNNITGLPVVTDDGFLEGIITEKDVLRLLDDVEQIPQKVADLMTVNVVCFKPEHDIHDIADSLRMNHFRRVPILDRGRLVGIVSRKDIVRHIRDLKQGADILKDSILGILY